MIKLGKMSSFAYASEKVENKEKMVRILEEDHLTEDKKVIHGIDHVEKLMQNLKLFW